MMNAPESIWPFSTGLGREAKQQSVGYCVKAVREEEGDNNARDIEDGVAGSGWMELSLERRWREGPPRAGKTPTIQPSVLQRGTKTGTPVCVCVCLCFEHAWIVHRRDLFVRGCVLYMSDGNLPLRNVRAVLLNHAGFSHQTWQSLLFAQDSASCR